MATPNPAQQLASDIGVLKTKLGWLQESVRLTKARDAIEDVQTKVTGMTQRITNLRTRGFVFEKDLESQATTFSKQWMTLSPSLNQQINLQSSNLLASLRPVEQQMTQLLAVSHNPAAARPLLARAQSAIDMLEDKVSAAEKAIGGMYNQLDNQIYQFGKHLDEIEYLLTQLAEATFQLLPTEGGISAIKAVWCKIGKEQKGDPEGVLYLTDQRLIFEQKEEIVTKKVLFVATEKQKVQAMQWETPVALLDKVTTSKQGMMKNEDHIEVRFLSGAPLEVVHLHIWQDCAAWQGLLNRAKSKDFDKDRAVAIDQAAVEKVKAAPTQCPSCGGNITTIVIRGMDSITCEYCGMVIRLADAPTTVPAAATIKELPWGTTAAILLRLGAQNSFVMASGKCSVAIIDPAVYEQKIGSDAALQLQVRSLLASKLGDVLGQISSITNADGLGARAVEISGAVQEAANPGLAAMGIKLTRVTIDGFSVNPAK